MKKRTIRLTEGELKGIIRNSVARIIREKIYDDDYADYEEFVDDDVEPDDAYDDVIDFDESEVDELEHIDEDDLEWIESVIRNLKDISNSLDPNGSIDDLIQDAASKLQKVVDIYK